MFGVFFEHPKQSAIKFLYTWEKPNISVADLFKTIRKIIQMDELNHW